MSIDCQWTCWSSFTSLRFSILLQNWCALRFSWKIFVAQLPYRNEPLLKKYEKNVVGINFVILQYIEVVIIGCDSEQWPFCISSLAYSFSLESRVVLPTPGPTHITQVLSPIKSYSIWMFHLFIFWSSVAGPAFWGLINPQWNMCSKGRRQSPINVEPEKLLFDPYLRPLHIDKHKVSAKRARQMATLPVSGVKWPATRLMTHAVVDRHPALRHIFFHWVKCTVLIAVNNEIILLRNR